MIARLVAILCLLTIAVPASAEPRQPTGKWVADFGVAQCVAFRNYGTEEDPLYLTLKAPPMGSVMQLLVVRKGGKLPAEQTVAKVTFDDRPAIKTSLLLYRPDKSEYRSYLINLPLSDFEGARTAKSVRVWAKGRLDETFALANVPALLKIMDDCVGELRRDFNIVNPHDFALVGGKSPPNPRLQRDAGINMQGLFNSDDYPADAVWGRQQGTTKFVLLIDETGKVADCSTIETSGVAVLDAQSCAVAKERASFKPAIGPDGKPAKDAFVQRITWRLE